MLLQLRMATEGTRTAMQLFGSSNLWQPRGKVSRATPLRIVCVLHLMS